MSVLSQELDRYLNIRRGLGYALSTDERILRNFVAFANSENTELVSSPLFLRWKEAFGVFMDVATSPNARHFPVTPVSGLYQNELATAADYVRFGNRSPEEALGAVEARVGREARRWE